MTSAIKAEHPKEIMKLELKHWSAYLPYKLQVQINWPNGISQLAELKAVGLHPGTGNENRITVFADPGDGGRQFILPNKPTKKTTLIKPILRPLSDLPQFMPEILKSLSKIDLSNCTFNENEYDENEKYWWVNAFDGDRVVAALQFDYNTFSIYEIGNDCDLFFDCYPQIDALNQLYKYHFDLHGLIDAGLAISINDNK